MYPTVHRRTKLPRKFQIFGASLVLLLVLETGVVLLLDPDNFLGNGDMVQHFFTILVISTHDLRGPLILLSDILLVFLFMLILLRPISLLLYLHTIQRQKKRAEYNFYFALTTVPNLTLDNMYIQSNAAHSYDWSERIPVLELAEQQQDHHVLFLGVPGAGKTTILKNYQHLIVQHRWKIIRGREKIPLYISMNDYSLFLKELQSSSPLTSEDTLESILQSYLYSRKNVLSGIQIIYPYLSQFMEEGRLLLLCDGLNEVDSNDQQLVCNQLLQMMEQELPTNRLIMTCREVDARENPLNQLVNKEAIQCVIINPLDQAQIEVFIRGYTATTRRKHHCPPEKILEVIDSSDLRLYCTNPMILSMLIELVEEDGEENATLFPTRGLLLYEFVSRLVEREQHKWENAPDELILFAFLGELACAARRAGERTAIQLSPKSRISRKKHRLGLALEDHLYTWLIGNPALSPIVIDQPDGEDDDQYAYASLAPKERADLITFAIDAHLIEIDINGKLIFRHEIIAEYFVAYYFLICDQKTAWHNVLSEELFDDISWYEPIVIWAELIDNPADLAKRIAIFGKQHPGQAVNAVTLSLNCLGVLPSLSSTENPLPSEVAEVVIIAVQDEQNRQKLADNFNKYAQKGGQKVYASLLRILTFPNIEDLMLQLNNRDIITLLLNHLEAVSDIDIYERDINCLIRVLVRYSSKSAEFSSMIVKRAELILNHASSSTMLCNATISILGNTHAPVAITVLLNYLKTVNDSNLRTQTIRKLSSQEPERIIGNLIQILQTTTPSPNQDRLHVDALEILRRLLAQRQVTSHQLQFILNHTITALSDHYRSDVRQKAHMLLQEQCKTAPNNAQGQETLKTVVQSLSMKRDTPIAKALVAILTNVGPLATPYLLAELHQATKKNKRLLILDIFINTKDQQALPDILKMVADPDVDTQQQIEKALYAYAPKSIPGLIEQILYGATVQVAERAVKILKDIRQDVVKPVMEKLQPVFYGRTHLLVEILEEFNDKQSIPALTALMEMPLTDPLLVKAITRTLIQYQDERIITPLLSILTAPQASFTAKTQQELKDLATKGLSSLGEIALDRLLDVLMTEPAPQTIHDINKVFYGMTLFPGEQLLERIRRIDDSQIAHMKPIFFMKEVEGARTLVKFLRHSDVRVRNFCKQTLEQIPGKYSAPALVDILQRSDMREEVTPLLLKNPESLPLLVRALADKERGDAAQTILLLFEPAIIPELTSALDHPNRETRGRASTILVTWGRQQPATIEKMIQLLKPALPLQAYETLKEILAHDLAPTSISFLLNALEHANLIDKIGGILQHLMQGPYRDQTRDELREALLTEHLQKGARDVLTTLKGDAIAIVGDLVTHPDARIARPARTIIGELGGAALPFIWQTAHDPNKQEYQSEMLSLFHNMDTADIQQPLVDLLTADTSQQMIMGLGLLLERVQGDQASSGTKKKIIPAILEYIYTRTDEQTALRIIAWLLLLGGSTTIHHIAHALQNHPGRYEPLIRTLLLLGVEAENTLLELLQPPTTHANAHLKAEVIGVLGMLREHQQVTRYALNLNKYGYNNTGRKNNPDEMTIALHAVGGLLAGGRWNIKRLETLENTGDSDAPVKELAHVLLGNLYNPAMQKLEEELQEAKQSLQSSQERYNKQIGALQRQSAEWETAYKREEQAKGILQKQYNDLYNNYKQIQQDIIYKDEENDQLKNDNAELQIQINQISQKPRYWGIPPIP